MAIIGITGKSGSGKSTYAKSLKGYYIDFDLYGHEVIDVNSLLLERHFGTSDRKKLGDIIFNNREKYHEFVDLIWKEQQREIDKAIEWSKVSGQDAILDFILLPKTKYWNICDKKILMETPYEVRKDRVLKRDNITEEYFEKREKASMEYDKTEMDEVIQYNNTEGGVCQTQ